MDYTLLLTDANLKLQQIVEFNAYQSGLVFGVVVGCLILWGVFTNV